MRKAASKVSATIAPDWSKYLIMSLVIPLLALYALFLAGDYLALLHLFPAPEFWSQNLLKANFVCYGPALLLISIMGNLQLYCPHLALNDLRQRAIACIAWLTLVLVLAANTLLLTLHFSFFSTDRYIRCWEPFPPGTRYYARTAEICEQHGLAPVQFLTPRSSAGNAAKN